MGTKACSDMLSYQYTNIHGFAKTAYLVSSKTLMPSPYQQSQSARQVMRIRPCVYAGQYARCEPMSLEQVQQLAVTQQTETSTDARLDMVNFL